MQPMSEIIRDNSRNTVIIPNDFRSIISYAFFVDHRNLKIGDVIVMKFLRYLSVTAVCLFLFSCSVQTDVDAQKRPSKEPVKDSLGEYAKDKVQADFENYFSKCGDSYYTEILTRKGNDDTFNPKEIAQFKEIVQLMTVSFSPVSPKINDIDYDLNKLKWQGYVEVSWKASRTYLISSKQDGKDVKPRYKEAVGDWSEWQREFYGYFTGHSDPVYFGNRNDGGANAAELHSRGVSFSAENKNSVWKIAQFKNPLRFWTLQNYGDGEFAQDGNIISFGKVSCPK